MNSLAKSILYQLKRDKLIYAVFFLVLGIGIIQVFVGDGLEANSASEYIGENGGVLYHLIYLFAGVVVARVCGADFGDKTFNYEILSGHTRRQTYVIRAGISMILICFGTLVLANGPIILMSVVKGFGAKIDIGSVILRQLLCVFPMLRTVSWFIFIIFAVRNQYAIMLLGFFFFNVSALVSGLPSYLLGITNIAKLCKYEGFLTFAFSGEEYYVYIGNLSWDMIVLTIAISVLMSAFWLLCGYVFYKREDLR